MRRQHNAGGAIGQGRGHGRRRLRGGRERPARRPNLATLAGQPRAPSPTAELSFAADPSHAPLPQSEATGAPPASHVYGSGCRSQPSSAPRLNETPASGWYPRMRVLIMAETTEAGGCRGSASGTRCRDCCGGRTWRRCRAPWAWPAPSADATLTSHPEHLVGACQGAGEGG